LVRAEQQFPAPRHFDLTQSEVRSHDARLAVRRPQQKVTRLVSDGRAQQVAGVGAHTARRLLHGWITDGGVARIARRQHSEPGGVG